MGYNLFRGSACKQQHDAASDILHHKFGHGRRSGLDEAVREHVRFCVDHGYWMARMPQLDYDSHAYFRKRPEPAL